MEQFRFQAGRLLYKIPIQSKLEPGALLHE